LFVADGRNICEGQWTYLFRAIDKNGKNLDFMLSEHRDEASATAFFVKAVGNNGWPDKVVIDKSGSNTVGLFNMNCLLVMCGWCWLITVLRTKYLTDVFDKKFLKSRGLVARLSLRAIAQGLKRAPSTISREERWASGLSRGPLRPARLGLRNATQIV
jgi:transposase-like protein